jgi:uncharacterized protein YllA (UPF0747 family)
VARGYHSQVNAADSLALFHIEGGRRRSAQDGAFIAGEQTFDAPALVTKAAARPAAFSPNVLLRPVVRTRSFQRCAAWRAQRAGVLGQLRASDSLGVPMPIMYPRASATLLDSAAPGS